MRIIESVHKRKDIKEKESKKSASANRSAIVNFFSSKLKRRCIGYPSFQQTWTWRRYQPSSHSWQCNYRFYEPIENIRYTDVVQVHNIVLYPDKHSWCKTTPIKQVVTWPQCSSQELDNNVCVGACFSYMVPHSEPFAPGDLIRPYCDSCQPLDSIWHTVTLDCMDEDNKPITIQKRVQIITNCSCSSCTETSRIKPDYNTLLQSLADENLDKNVNIVEDTPDILLAPNLNSSNNSSIKDAIFGEEKFVQFLREFRAAEGLEKSDPKMREISDKLTADELDIEKLRDMWLKYKEEEAQKHEQHHSAIHHHGPHHSLFMDADVKEKIDVEPHLLHPAVAGQEISYHDNVLGEKDKKKDF